MGELEHGAQHRPEHERDHHVVEQDSFQGVEQQRNAERCGQEDRLAGEQDDQVPPLGAGDLMGTDPAGDQLSKVVDELPLDGQQPYNGQR